MVIKTSLYILPWLILVSYSNGGGTMLGNKSPGLVKPTWFESCCFMHQLCELVAKCYILLCLHCLIWKKENYVVAPLRRASFTSCTEVLPISGGLGELAEWLAHNQCSTHVSYFKSAVTILKNESIWNGLNLIYKGLCISAFVRQSMCSGINLIQCKMYFA